MERLALENPGSLEFLEFIEPSLMIVREVCIVYPFRTVISLFSNVPQVSLEFGHVLLSNFLKGLYVN